MDETTPKHTTRRVTSIRVDNPYPNATYLTVAQVLIDPASLEEHEQADDSKPFQVALVEDTIAVYGMN